MSDFIKSQIYSFLVLIIALLSACSNQELKEEICVSAAVSLKDALLVAKQEFEKENRHSNVLFNFGASGQLSQQIIEGAPVDVFISASDKQMQDLSQAGLVVQSSLKQCAGNLLVVLSNSKGAQNKLLSFTELKQFKRIAMGNPKTVPVGDYARQSLVKAGIYDELLKNGQLVLAEDARQVLAYVESGDVDAGIVYNTDVVDRGKIVFLVEGKDAEAIKYKIALLKGSEHQGLAAKFIEFFTGAEGKKILQKKGFSI